MKKIAACGCSITHGYFAEKSGKIRINKSYADIFAESKGCEMINLSKPGSSNYFIAKQVEFALTLKPDFIIVGLTSSHRFDYQENFLDKPLDRTPVLQDWSYKLMGKTPYTQQSRHYNSNPIPRLNTFDHHKEFVDYILKYVNFDIKQDQDRFIISGLYRMLNESGIPFVMIDWTNLIGENKYDKYVMRDLNWYEIVKKFNTDADGTHFDSDGQSFAAAALSEFVSELWNNI